MLHLLREKSVEEALESGADTSAVCARNQRTLRALGASTLEARRCPIARAEASIPRGSK